MLAFIANPDYLLRGKRFPPVLTSWLMLVRQTTAANFIDVLDHVVDKGIVIDAWVALWSAGINLVKSDDARLVVVGSTKPARSARSARNTDAPPPRSV